MFWSAIIYIWLHIFSQFKCIGVIARALESNERTNWRELTTDTERVPMRHGYAMIGHQIRSLSGSRHDWIKSSHSFTQHHTKPHHIGRRLSHTHIPTVDRTDLPPRKINYWLVLIHLQIQFNSICKPACNWQDIFLSTRKLYKHIFIINIQSIQITIAATATRNRIV